MKIKVLNHNIDIVQGTGFIPYPYFEVNYTMSRIVVGNNVKISGEDVDKVLLNQVLVKGIVKILNYYYNGLGQSGDIVYDWLISKTNILKEVKE